MDRSELLSLYNDPKRRTSPLSTHFSKPKSILGRLHLHFLIERPDTGGPVDFTQDFSPPPGTDEFVVFPHGWDFYFIDDESGKPVEAPLHGIMVSAVGWFEAATGKCHVQIRGSLENAANDQFWIGQVGIEGLFLG